MMYFFPDICNSSFVQFQIWDLPGQFNTMDPSFDTESIFGGCGAIIFVIDAQVIVYTCIVIGDPVIKRNSLTGLTLSCLCLAQARTWISDVICHGLFFCVQRGDC